MKKAENIYGISLERKKQIFDKIATYAEVRQKVYRFEEVPGNNGSVVKHLYFDEDLVGIGRDISARTAKLRCAINALSNLK